jgi:hypothetical protein
MIDVLNLALPYFGLIFITGRRADRNIRLGRHADQRDVVDPDWPARVSVRWRFRAKACLGHDPGWAPARLEKTLGNRSL